MTSLIRNNKISVFAREQKNEILRNADVSFDHGIDHFSEYADGEKNIKFAVLHIFNTIELLTKAYLGSINLNLLKEKIDDGVYNDKSKMPGIKVLLDRMNKFSDVDFGEELREKIEILRIKRNEIEHKRFVSKDEDGLLILMCEIINGLFVFSKNHMDFDICPELLSNAKVKFHNTRIKLDENYARVIKEVGFWKSKGYVITECPSCLNLTVPYKKKSKVKCFMCNEFFYVHKCYNCQNNLCLDIQNGQGICDECTNKGIESVGKAFSISEKEDQNSRASLPKEDYKK